MRKFHNKWLHRSQIVWRYLWPAPWTLLALALGWPASFAGATLQRRGNIIICYGGPLTKLLRAVPIPGGAGAITFGHTVLAQNKACADHSYEHELIHVGQYERWGIFFVPAYLLASLILILRHRDPYYENPFEKEAFADDLRRRAKHASR